MVEYCDTPGTERREQRGIQSRPTHWRRPLYSTSCYTRSGRRIIVVTDRISAFDVVLGTIPFKGQVLNQIAASWFEATAPLTPHPVLAVPDPTLMVATECKLLPVEFVMRAYLTGVTTTSIWYHYERGARTFCGHKLPEGMRKNQKLEKAIL